MSAPSTPTKPQIIGWHCESTFPALFTDSVSIAKRWMESGYKVSAMVRASSAAHAITAEEAELIDYRAPVIDVSAPEPSTSTEARTGNTADHQAGYFAGIEQGQANERHNAAIRSALAAGDALTDAARDVLVERRRQISGEGWERERDDTYKHGELAAAAASYAQCAGLQGEGATTENAFKTPYVENWPWSEEWWKPSPEPRRNLVKAGALILAEIERLDRAAIAAQRGKGGAA